jgi:hypothetical protein
MGLLDQDTAVHEEPMLVLVCWSSFCWPSFACQDVLHAMVPVPGGGAYRGVGEAALCCPLSVARNRAVQAVARREGLGVGRVGDARSQQL